MASVNCSHTQMLLDKAEMHIFVHTKISVFKNLATNTNDLEILDLILGGEGIIQLNWGFMMGQKEQEKGTG